MRLRAVELLRVRLPLTRPFVTAHGTTTTKDALLVHACTDVGDGWGECVAPATPSYLPDTIDTARLVLRDHLVPRAFAGASFDDVRGHGAAKAALECARLDARLRAEGVSLASHLGGGRASVPAGVVVGIGDDVGRYAAAGYRRVKCKIAPGRDLDVLRAARAEVGDAIELAADANGSYTVDDVERLSALDDCELQCLEQPLPPDALLDHAVVASRLRTPICLDETITSAAVARDAIRVGACRVVSVKAGRVGGLQAAVRVHDVCRAAAVPALCGGMLETGVGRAAAVALASLPGFTTTGDLSASDRYFAPDLTEPFVLDDDGALRVPTGPGLGVDPRADVLARVTVARELLTPR